MSVDIDRPVKPELSDEEARFDRRLRLTAVGLTWCFAAALVMVLGPILLGNIGLSEEAGKRAGMGLSVVVMLLHCVGCVMSCWCPGAIVRRGRVLIVVGMVLAVAGMVLETWFEETAGMCSFTLIFAGMTAWLIFLWQLAKNSLSEEIATFALSLVVLAGVSAVVSLPPFLSAIVSCVSFCTVISLLPFGFLLAGLELVLYGGLLLGLRTRILQRTDRGWKAEEEDWLS